MKANSDGVFHPSCGAVARHCTTRLENTHGTFAVRFCTGLTLGQAVRFSFML